MEEMSKKEQRGTFVSGYLGDAAKAFLSHLLETTVCKC